MYRRNMASTYCQFRPVILALAEAAPAVAPAAVDMKKMYIGGDPPDDNCMKGI